ncbi:MAG TPA: class I SAM-dependent methyltransferase [Gaiellaceae bacterium]|nr:class I SAM-dependent methyltransferase [Gaiellaceae bacterium]
MGLIPFCGLGFGTRPGVVMTPRPASERLVRAAVGLVGDRPARVVDVGTGSGALAVAIAARAPRARVWATDSSPAAVELACANVRRHGLLHRVVVLEGDLLDPVPGPVDLVVANLPYLPLAERFLHQDVADEPPEAVFAPDDGLEPYRRLLEAAEERLAPDGAVVLQFRRSVLHAGRERLGVLRARLEHEAILAREAA